MTDALADTSVFVGRESGRDWRGELPERLGVSVITIGELRAGVLAARELATRDRRVGTLGEALALGPHPVTDDVAAAWARLRLALREAGMRMPVNDSWIAATAIALGVPVATHDDDYDGVPGLDVIRV